MRFVKSTVIHASPETVFGFHERPDALALLQPPWSRTEILQPPASLAVGTHVVLRTGLGPLRQTIEAEHVAYEPGHMFADRMVRGPFRHWLHRHVVTPHGPDASLLTDDVDFELPLGLLGRLLGGPLVRWQLTRLFAYRHEVTRRECERPVP